MELFCFGSRPRHSTFILHKPDWVSDNGGTRGVSSVAMSLHAAIAVVRLLAVFSSAIVLAGVSIEEGVPVDRTDGRPGTTYRCVYGQHSPYCRFVLATAAISFVYSVLSMIIETSASIHRHFPACPRLTDFKAEPLVILAATTFVDVVFAILWLTSFIVQAHETTLPEADAHLQMAAAFSFLSFASFVFLVLARFRSRRTSGDADQPDGEAGESPGSSSKQKSIASTYRECLVGTIAFILSLIVVSSVADEGYFALSLPSNKPSSNLTDAGDNPTVSALTTTQSFQVLDEKRCVFAADQAACTLALVSGTAVCILLTAALGCYITCLLVKKELIDLRVPMQYVRKAKLIQTGMLLQISELWAVVFGYTVWRWGQVTDYMHDQMTHREQNGAIAVLVCSFLSAVLWLGFFIFKWINLDEVWFQSPGVVYAVAGKDKSAGHAQVKRRLEKCRYYHACWRYLCALMERSADERIARDLLFRHENDRCYCKKCGGVDLERGCFTNAGERFSVPKGWCRFPVNTQMMLCRGGVVLEKRGDEIDDWHVAYHGTLLSNFVPILVDGKLNKPGEYSRYFQKRIEPRHGHYNASHPSSSGMDHRQVFASPSAIYASHYYAEGQTNYKDDDTFAAYNSAKIILEVAVRPGKYDVRRETVDVSGQIDQAFPNHRLEWCIPDSNNVVVTAVLVELLQSA